MKCLAVDEISLRQGMQKCWDGLLYWRKMGDSSGGIRGVIISKLGDGEQIRRIVLLVVAIYSEVLFQSLIHLFGLSVALRVIKGGKVEFHVQGFSSCPEEQ